MAPSTIDLPAIKRLSWTSNLTYSPTNIVSYNLSVGVDGSDLSRCWEDHPNFHVLPTFAFLAVVDLMGKVTQSMPDFLPNFRSYNHVHGEHFLEQYRQFPPNFPGTNITSNASIVDIVDRSKGVTVVVGITTSETSTGEKLCYNEWTSFIRQVPGEGASPSVPVKPEIISNRDPDAVASHQTTHTQSALYRATTTEWNPLHISPAHAKEGGFRSPILSGSCTIGTGIKHIIDTFADGDVGRFKSAKLRLSAPVFIGEKVLTEMWVDKGSDTSVSKVVYRQVVVADELAGSQNRVVINNAVVELRSPRSKI